MANRWRRGVRSACGIGLFVVGGATVPAACLYPDYSFDEREPAGGAGGAGSSSSQASGSGGTGGQGGSTSSTSGSGSGSGGGTGGMAGAEDCFNGTDDDGDGDTDCADTDCNPIAVCVSSVPFGWSGPAALFEGVPAQEPACPAAFPSPTPYKGNHSPTGAAATCSACGCEAPAGETCNLPTELKIHNKPCGQQPTWISTLKQPANWSGACHSPDYIPSGDMCDGSPCNASILSAAPTVSGGSCASKGGQASVPQMTWAILGKACGDPPTGGGCGAGNACRPKPPLPFIDGLCISKSGDQACPAGAFTEKHVFYEDFTDTRGCTECICGTPAGSSCAASISTYSDQFINTCLTGVATFTAGQCVDLSGNPTVAGRTALIMQPPGGGSCASIGGGQPTGSVTPTTPTTFCCTP